MMAQTSYLKISVLLALLGIAAINAQFLDQPDAGTLFVPVNDQVTLSCSVDVGYSVDWEVRINNRTPLYAARALHDAAFMRSNFSFTGVTTNKSTLIFGIFNETGSQTNNETTITCIAQLGVSGRVSGNETHVIFYDAPPPPTDLSVTENELGFLNISWSLGFIEGVPVNYTLTVLNLNTTSAQPIIIAGLLDQHYVFETSRPCDVYSFTVTAVTAAGNSTPSQEIILTRNNNDMCLYTATPVPATDANGSTGLSGSAIAGIVIGIVAVIIIGIIIIITVVLTCQKEMPIREYQLDGPRGLTSSQGEVLVVEEGKQGITVFKDCRLAKFISVGKECLMEITVHNETGNIFVTTGRSGEVIKLNSKGEWINSIKSFEFAKGLCIDKNNQLYVCDTKAGQLKVFDLDLQHIKTLTGKVKGSKSFQEPRDVAFDENSNIYIAEKTGIRVLTHDGAFKKRICKNLNGVSGLKIVDNSIFIASHEGISLCTNEVHCQNLYGREAFFKEARSITVDSNGYVYFSTTEGKMCIHTFKPKD